MKNKIRTRFAPSPTGFLHVGGARTALFSWLYARHLGGEFILRIEDTDQLRSTQEAIQAILDGMEWLGLHWDKGPFYQMRQLERYQAVAEQLIQQSKAYRCTCSKERLESMRAEQMLKKQKPKYDGHCREKSLGEKNQSFVVRFKNPTEGVVSFKDLVYGSITVANSELDDFVMLRSDGVPTYNFSVVVDDNDMEISHVIRGDDHINNTPRQINLYAALGVTVPQYAHVPMILGSDGKKLSKRHGAVSVMQYEQDGFLPEALLNYLVRLGWAHGDQEIFSVEEMIQYFDLSAISKSPATFNNEKLLWLNQHYLKTQNPQTFKAALQKQFKALNINIDKGPALEKVVKAQAERCRTLKEIAEKSTYFYTDSITIDPQAAQKNLTPEQRPQLTLLKTELEALEKWEAPAIHQVIEKVSKALNVGMGKVAMPLRVAVTGNVISPSIDLTLELLGRARSLVRLGEAIQ